MLKFIKPGLPIQNSYIERFSESTGQKYWIFIRSVQ
ncbi:hypothetical protein EPYR_03018 [Erwinia pyrifoliae DSM 12163]|nr:hypothetical protein EPYR_03018 [Erwinia pyrifoliae DSM 12163]